MSCEPNGLQGSRLVAASLLVKYGRNVTQNLLQPHDSICGSDSYSTFVFATVTKAIMNQVYPSLLYATKRMKCSLWMCSCDKKGNKSLEC